MKPPVAEPRAVPLCALALSACLMASTAALQLAGTRPATSSATRSATSGGLEHGLDSPPPPGGLRIDAKRRDRKGRWLPATDAVVWLEGSPRPALADPLGTPTASREVAARKKRFTPRVVAVPAGGEVSFPNYDGIYHNVFSLSSTKSFDLGLYRDGTSRSVSFDTPGVVKVYCNIHPKMAAYVIVVDGENYAVVDERGEALLEGVPPGDWTLRVWDEKGGELRQAVQVRSGRTEAVEVRLDASGWRRQAHTNKYGEDYPPPDDEDSRY